MTRARLLIYAALVPTAIAIGILAGKVLAFPTTLRVAVGVAGGENYRLVEAMNQVFTRERTGLRLKIIRTPTATDAAAKLDAGEAELAVSRADVAIPRQGDTVVILHSDPVIILATQRSGVTRMPDLRGKKIGVAGGLAANQVILRQLLTYYGIPLEEVSIVAVDPSELAGPVRDGRIDVAFLVQPTASKALRDAYVTVSEEGGGPAAFVPVPEAEAIAERNATIDDEELTQGSLSGNPIVPSEAMKTIAVSHRLFAQRDLAEGTIAELTRLIFVHKAAIAGENPLAARIEKPETDNESTLAVHAGATAYYDGEVKTFMDRYGDWIYVGAMVLGFGGSAVAAVLSRAGTHHRRAALSMVQELRQLLEAARLADAPALDAIQQRADAIFTATLTGATESRLEPGDITIFSFAFDHLRTAIEERRAALLRPQSRDFQRAS